MSQITNESLIICDVCDTLYRSNTTADFVRFVVERHGGPLQKLAYQSIMTRWSPVYVASALLYKGVGFDLGRRLLVSLLRGMERDELDRIAEAFVDDVLETRRVATTHQRLEDARSRDVPVVLASASIDPVIRVIAERLGAEAVSSVLRYDDGGTCLGVIDVDMTGQKLDALRHRLSDGTRLTVITDNFTDRALLEFADERVVILRHPSHRERWDELDAEFVEI